MSLSRKPKSVNQLPTKTKLSVETIEPLVLLSASHFNFEHHEHADHHATEAFSTHALTRDHEHQVLHEINHDHGSGHKNEHCIHKGRGGDDLLLGRAGNGSLNGSSGDVLIRGGNGDDVLKASSGSDLIKGGAGNDTLIGRTGGSTLKGESGDDVIVDGGGNDLIDGGYGNDLLVVDRQKSDYTIRDLANNDFEIQSSSGTDVVTAVERIRFADGEYVVADLLRQISQATGVVTAPVPANPITPDSVAGKAIHGTASSDQITATAGDDLVKGGRGDDNIQGGQGDDILKGGAGNDVLNGGEGDDHLLGGAGDDTLIVGNGNDVVDGGAGNDTAVFNTVFDVVDIGNGVVRVQSIEGTDTITHVEQLSIDGKVVSLDTALLYHGLPTTTDGSLQQTVDTTVASSTSGATQSSLNTTEVEFNGIASDASYNKRTV